MFTHSFTQCVTSRPLHGFSSDYTEMRRLVRRQGSQTCVRFPLEMWTDAPWHQCSPERLCPWRLLTLNVLTATVPAHFINDSKSHSLSHSYFSTTYCVKCVRYCTLSSSGRPLSPDRWREMSWFMCLKEQPVSPWHSYFVIYNIWKSEDFSSLQFYFYFYWLYICVFFNSYFIYVNTYVYIVK